MTTDILFTGADFADAQGLSTDITSSFAPSSVFALEVPNLSTSSILGLPLAGAASAIADTITALEQIQGSVALDNGILTPDLITPFGPVQGSFDLVNLVTDLNQTVQGISGSLTLSNGLASGNLIVGDQEFELVDGEFANLIGSFVSDFLSTVDGTISFSNGQFALDLPTPVGDIEGTIGFGNGALDVNLTTPVAPINFSIDFPDNAQLTLPIPQLGNDAILNLATGQVELDLVPFLPGPEAVVPISALSGNATLNDGVADLTVQLGTIALDTEFDFATAVGGTLTDFLSSATGVLSIGDGSLSANLQTGLGDFVGILPVSGLLTDLVETIPQYQGTLTVGSGIVTVDATTPFGVVQDSFDYGQYLDDVAGFFDQFVA